MQKRMNDVYKLSEYLNIVNVLLEYYSFSSLFKVEVTAMLLFNQIKTNMELRKTSIPMMSAFLNEFHSIVLSNYMDFVYISKAIRINEINGSISINDDVIVKNKKLEIAEFNEYFKKENIIEIMNEINSMSIRSFIQEVISNV